MLNQTTNPSGLHRDWNRVAAVNIIYQVLKISQQYKALGQFEFTAYSPLSSNLQPIRLFLQNYNYVSILMGMAGTHFGCASLSSGT